MVEISCVCGNEELRKILSRRFKWKRGAYLVVPEADYVIVYIAAQWQRGKENQDKSRKNPALQTNYPLTRYRSFYKDISVLVHFVRRSTNIQTNKSRVNIHICKVEFGTQQEKPISSQYYTQRSMQTLQRSMQTNPSS